MNAQEYCESVEQKHRLQKERISTVPIRDDNSPLVSLKESGFDLLFEPSIKKGYRYLVRTAIFDRIGRISRLLREDDKVLIIRSVWRSFKHQRFLWEKNFEITRKKFPDKELNEIEDIVANFIALRKESMHSTGGAVDALIYDLVNGCVMEFGTNDGHKIKLNEKCYPLHPDISTEAKKNRKLLIGLFEKEGFVCDLTEYWHFDYGNVVWALEKGKEYSIYDVVRHAR